MLTPLNSSSLLLSISFLTKFLVVYVIAQLEDVEDTSKWLVWMAAGGFVGFFIRGRISNAKDLYLKGRLQKQTVVKIYREVIRRLYLFLVPLVVISVIFVPEDWFGIWGCCGLAYGIIGLMHNQTALYSEAVGTAVRAYQLIAVDLLLVLFFALLSTVEIYLLIRIAVPVFLPKFWHSFETRELYSMPEKNVFAKIELATISAGLIEVPVLYALSAGKEFIDYSLLTRLYSAIPLLYGQLTRPYWSKGGMIALQFPGHLVSLDKNIFGFLFACILLLGAYFVDIFVLKLEADGYMVTAVISLTILTILNRFLKNFFLNKGLFQFYAGWISWLYMFYAAGLILIFMFALSIWEVLIAKIFLSLVISSYLGGQWIVYKYKNCN